MIRSREIALRCAAVLTRKLPYVLCKHRPKDERVHLGLQVALCRDDASRRLILGKSQ